MNTSAGLSVRGACKRFTNGAGFGPIDLEVDPGQTLVLLGPSGSGKSTLLRAIAGLEPLNDGEIHFRGERLQALPGPRRPLVWLPQRPALYPGLRVAQQLELVQPWQPRGTGAAATPGWSRTKIIEFLRLDRLLNRTPDELSGGELQRVVWAKLLLRNAPLWLLDEPFNALDPIVRADFHADLHLLREVSQATIVLVTHDPNEALLFGQQVGVIVAGKLLSVGTPLQQRLEPRHPFTAYCFGWNLIAGRVSNGEQSEAKPAFVSDCGLLMMPLPDTSTNASKPDWSSQESDSLTLGIRPEDISAIQPGQLFRDESEIVRLMGWKHLFSEPVGSGSLLTLARGTTRLRVEWRFGTPLPGTTPTDWYFPAEKCRWFVETLHLYGLRSHLGET